MANYISTTRTNYFHVTDMEKFKDIISRCQCEDTVQTWTKTDELGETMVGFGAFDEITGTVSPGTDPDDNEEDPDVMFDRFVSELQAIIRPDDACVIFNTGYEKLRYVAGHATIITHGKVGSVNLKNEAVKKAKELLDDPAWDTECEY